MILRLELFSSIQDATVLSLLDFPKYPLLPQGTVFSIKRRSRGKVFQHKIKSLDGFANKLKNQQFNALEIKYQFKVFEFPGSFIRIKSMQGFFRVSPTNSIWADKETWPEPETYAARREFLSYGSKAGFIKNGQMILFPTFFDLYIDLTNEGTTEAVYQFMYDHLPTIIPDSIIKLGAFGYAELEVDNSASTIFLHTIPARLASKLENFAMLNERFDSLHPLMIGPANVCSGLASSLGDDVSVQYKSFPQSVERLGMLYIPSNILNNPDHKRYASSWIIQ